MKIALYTITEGENYGNRLQNYAMQEILKKHGHSVKTILENSYKNNPRMIAKLYIKRVLNIKNDGIARRIYSFRRFNKKYLKFDKNKLTYNKEYHTKGDYECYIVGSDQVWNPNFTITTGASFLDFAGEKRRVAVSASFGVKEIKDKKKKEEYAEYLRNFEAVSVRENSGVGIVKELIGKDVPVLLDPTLMLSKFDWYNIMRRPHGMKDKKYVMCYLLGKYEEDVIDGLEEYARNHSLEIIMLENDNYQLGYCNDIQFGFGPSEFLWLIANCEKVITDSFHAVVFSLIFRKKVIAIPRKSQVGDMSTRLDNLSKTFKINNLITYNNDFEQEAKVDFNMVDDVLKDKQEEFDNFIYKNIDSVNN